MASDTSRKSKNWSSAEQEAPDFTHPTYIRTVVRRGIKWFAPGMRIKRWLLVSVAGLMIFSMGLLLGADMIEEALPRFGGAYLPQRHLEGIVLMLVGLWILISGARKFVNTLVSAYARSPHRKQLVEVLYDRRYLDQGLKIVTLGGVTGLSTLLRGLKVYSSNLVAVVTVSDDGGSSGKLRQELGILAPGDIRNCLVALADDESLLKELFNYRFQDGGLGGHSFGNLFLAALNDLAGDFEMAVRLSSQILAIRGRVLPATLSPVTLCALYQDGTVMRGESAIPGVGRAIEKVYLEPEQCEAPREVLEGIRNADAIILGPGSLYTSVIPNLLVNGVAEAIRANPAAPKIYICNVMTQPGETDNMGAADHLQELLSHADITVDYAIVNLADPSRLKERYAASGAQMVEPQLDRIAALRVEGVGANLLSETDMVRHDPDKLARTIVDLIARHRSGESTRTGELGQLRAVK